MKRRFLISLILIFILVSCSTSGDEYLSIADSSSDINERIEIYKQRIKEDSSDYRAYYNLAYMYLYNEDYENAECILKEAVELFPNHFRFYSALIYLYQEKRDVDKELETIYEALSFMPADERLRERALDILQMRGDDALNSFAEETLYYFPKNQRAINILSESYPFFKILSKDGEREKLINFDLPLFKENIMMLVHPKDYKNGILTLFSGTLKSQAG